MVVSGAIVLVLDPRVDTDSDSLFSLLLKLCQARGLAGFDALQERPAAHAGGGVASFHRQQVEIGNRGRTTRCIFLGVALAQVLEDTVARYPNTEADPRQGAALAAKVHEMLNNLCARNGVPMLPLLRQTGMLLDEFALHEMLTNRGDSSSGAAAAPFFPGMTLWDIWHFRNVRVRSDPLILRDPGFLAGTYFRCDELVEYFSFMQCFVAHLIRSGPLILGPVQFGFWLAVLAAAIHHRGWLCALLGLPSWYAAPVQVDLGFVLAPVVSTLVACVAVGGGGGADSYWSKRDAYVFAVDVDTLASPETVSVLATTLLCVWATAFVNRLQLHLEEEEERNTQLKITAHSDFRLKRAGSGTVDGGGLGLESRSTAALDARLASAISIAQRPSSNVVSSAGNNRHNINSSPFSVTAGDGKSMDVGGHALIHQAKTENARREEAFRLFTETEEIKDIFVVRDLVAKLQDAAVVNLDSLPAGQNNLPRRNFIVNAAAGAGASSSSKQEAKTTAEVLARYLSVGHPGGDYRLSLMKMIRKRSQDDENLKNYTVDNAYAEIERDYARQLVRAVNAGYAIYVERQRTMVRRYVVSFLVALFLMLLLFYAQTYMLLVDAAFADVVRRNTDFLSEAWFARVCAPSPAHPEAINAAKRVALGAYYALPQVVGLSNYTRLLYDAVFVEVVLALPTIGNVLISSLILNPLLQRISTKCTHYEHHISRETFRRSAALKAAGLAVMNALLYPLYLLFVVNERDAAVHYVLTTIFVKATLLGSVTENFLPRAQVVKKQREMFATAENEKATNTNTITRRTSSEIRRERDTRRTVGSVPDEEEETEAAPAGRGTSKQMSVKKSSGPTLTRRVSEFFDHQTGGASSSCPSSGAPSLRNVVLANYCLEKASDSGETGGAGEAYEESSMMEEYVEIAESYAYLVFFFPLSPLCVSLGVFLHMFSELKSDSWKLRNVRRRVFRNLDSSRGLCSAAVLLFQTITVMSLLANMLLLSVHLGIDRNHPAFLHLLLLEHVLLFLQLYLAGYMPKKLPKDFELIQCMQGG